jgi:MATE family multidrug resistance protein
VALSALLADPLPAKSRSTCRTVPPRHLVRSIFRLAWPVFIAQIAIMASGVLDTVMVGRYGAVDLAAIGIGSSIYFTVFIGLVGIVQALSPIAAQLHGANRDGEIGEEVRQTVWIAFGLTFIGAALLSMPGPFLDFSGAPQPVQARVREYLAWIALSLPPTLLFRVFYSLTTAVSRPRAVMMLNLVYFAIKAPLTYCLIYGAFGMPEMGGPGAGLATAIASWCIFVAAWLLCLRDPFYRPFQVFARWSWPNWPIIWTHLRLGVPMGLTFFVEVTSFTFMALFLARLGAATSAAHQIAANVSAVLYMVGLAIGNATGVLIAQAIGRGNWREARSTGLAGMGMCISIGIIAAIVLWYEAGAIVGLYTRDPAVARIATALLAFVAFYQIVDALQVVIVNALRGYRVAFVPMVVYTGSLWGLGLGGGYLIGLTDSPWAAALGLPVPMGAPGFWLSAAVSVAVAALILFVYFLRVSEPRDAEGIS